MNDTYLNRDGDKASLHNLSGPKSKASNDKEIKSPILLSPTKLYYKLANNARDITSAVSRWKSMSQSKSKPKVNYAGNNPRTVSGFTSSYLARHWPKVQPIIFSVGQA